MIKPLFILLSLSFIFFSCSEEKQAPGASSPINTENQVLPDTIALSNGEWALLSNHVYFILNKKNPANIELMERFNRGLSELRASGELKELQQELTNKAYAAKRSQ